MFFTALITRCDTLFTCVVMNGRFLESHWFVWVTQMNHLPMDIDHEKHQDWLSMQVPAASLGNSPQSAVSAADLLTHVLSHPLL